ncbi:MAG: hypothetical protein JWQ91_110 [Aeromicrobium sp.]|uniref:hypothetical protein n=1 Tax=Aeromicrobium sp. TaxID=1871063 RepID=UPI002614FD49|nr:hypothetical protein [Aeromicrobium sp.]MCW2823193.1 hypothetical protein [Aeromicrobium sp.]
MEQRTSSLGASDALYDVLLANRPPEELLERFTAVSVWATRAQTSLTRRGSGPPQLDALLESLCSVGARLLEVHREPTGWDDRPTYEVRVEGEVGEPLLRWLNWSHRVVPGQTHVRIVASADELHHFLQACTASGAGIQRVHRLSRDRADVPGARRRPGD